MLLDCVVFDLDGVLWDTCDYHSQAFEDSFKKFDINIEFNYKDIAGMSTKKAFEKLLTDNNQDVSNIKEMVRYKQYLAHKNIKDNPPVSKDMHKTLNKLISLNFKIGIASSTSRKNLNVFLDYLLTKKIIPDFSLSGDDVIDSKPSPEIYKKSIELSNSHHSRCLVIEDSKNGLIAADKAGCNIIQISKKKIKLIDSKRLLGVTESVNHIPSIIKNLIN